ncbi:MAG: diguanylate cyclase [Spirochaetaceae bacterium]|jgi:diguanylate cyclase (GGDEF)-like protein|nr:diguanylate cyclase [Spirochaetaceae bacterium]
MNILILCDWPGSSDYHNGIIGGIEDCCKQIGHNVITFAIGVWASDILVQNSRYHLYNLINSKNIHGIICFSATVSVNSGMDHYIDFLNSKTRVPILHLSDKILNNYSIDFDNEIAFEQRIRHLCDYHEFKNFVYISGDPTNKDGMLRLKCIQRVLEEYHIPLDEDHIYYGGWDIESGKKGFNQLIKHKPKVIVCANDYLAFGAYSEALAKGFTIPHDLVITGYDNISMDNFHELPFTTIKQPFHLLGYKAAKKLNSMINSEKIPHHLTIPTKLIIKESCGCGNKHLDEQDEEIPQVIPVLLDQAQEKMLEAYKKHCQAPGKNYLIRQWNGIVQQLLSFNVKSPQIRTLLDLIIHDLQNNTESCNSLKDLNEQILQLDNITMDMVFQKQTDEKQEEDQILTLTHIMFEIYKEQVMTTLSLEKAQNNLRNLFVAMHNKNAFIVFYQDKENNPKYNKGKLFFSMRNGEVDDLSSNDLFDTHRDILPQGFWPEDSFSFIVNPLFVETEIIGYIIFDCKHRPSELNEYVSRSLSATYSQFSMAVELNEKNQQMAQEISLRIESENQIQKLLDELKNLSLKDQLTGLYNRRGFLTVGEPQIKQFLREKTDFLVMFCDMDDLKGINDNYGHKEGDLAISSMAQVLQKSLRDSDIIARLGGDEFTVLLGMASPINLEVIEKRIKTNLLEINQQLNKPYKIDFSYGFCSNKESGFDELSKMMEMADHELYIAKKRKKA